MDKLEQAKRPFFEALSAQEKGELIAAERLYEDALVLAPDRASIMNNLAVLYIQSAKYLQARALCERCLAIDPRDRHALVHLGICRVKLNAAAEALEAFDAALALAPDDPHAAANRGGALLELNRFDEAIASCERALSVEPDFADALNILGNTLVKSGRADEALECYRRALTAQPDHGETLINLSSTLLRLGRDDEANDTFRRSIESRPADARRYVAFADALRMQYRLGAATEQYEAALLRDSDLAEARYGRGCVRLLEQDYRVGWQDYESRLQSPEYRNSSFRRDPASVLQFEERARWKGPADMGKVAIWAEQGLGDKVLFSTLIPELIGTGASIVYELDARLLAPYRRALPGVRFIARDDPPHPQLLETEAVLAAGSLPRFFRSSLADFARQPQALIQALPERAQHYRSELDKLGHGIKVALSWHSARDHWWARRKNIALSALSPLLRMSGAQFVDVQYGDTDDERRHAEATAGVRIERFREVDHFRDLDELLAILAACDLVVTTSNATAHLAGALGKPTWALFAGDRPPFHYWAHRGDYRCAWYPSVEIVTAPDLADWPALVQHAAGKLSRLI